MPRRVATAIVTLSALVIALALCRGSTQNGPPAASPPASTGSPSTMTLGRDRVVFDSDRTGNFEVFVMRDDGGDVRQLTSDARFDSWWARLSPERGRILFYRTPKGVHDRDFTKTSLWVMHADGSGQRELRAPAADGWEMQGHAEWSPDGRRLVMVGGSRINPQIFVTDSAGRAPRQVTARGGTNIDPSWARDGQKLLFIGCPRAICFENDYEVYVIAVSGGEATRLTENGIRDHDPYFSPDGSRIAWLAQTDTSGPAGVWNIFVMNADGTAKKNLTNDRQISSRPEWSVDGSRIFFHRLEQGRAGFGIFVMQADGSGRVELTREHLGNNEYPSN